MKRLFLLLAFPLIANAWEPTKPIEVYTPFSAGNAMEISARIVTKEVEKNTKATFVVVNKPGAGGSLVNDYMFKQPATGYFALSGSVPALGATDKIMMSTKDFSAKDFTYVLNLVSIPMTLVTSPNDPVNSIKDFVKVSKSEKITIGDPGAAARLFYELLQQHIGFEEGNSAVVRVDYKGPADVLNDVMAGHIRFGVMPVKTIPNVQTFNSVYPDVVFNLDIPLVLPPNTPSDVVAWYNREFKKALLNKEVQDTLALNMMYVNTKLLDSKDITKYVLDFDKRYDPVVSKVISSQKGN
jgi:tripartite-type tricarboxylate transporter receptor subunit TctC